MTMTPQEKQRINELINRIWDLTSAERLEFATLSHKREQCQRMPILERKTLNTLRRQIRNKQRRELALHGQASG